MNDLLVRMLVIIAVYWGASFALGMVSGPAWGFTLASAALLYLLATQMSRLDPAPDAAMPGGGTMTGPEFPGEPQPQAATAPKPGAASALAAASCGIAVLDREFRLFWCNDALAGHFGNSDTKIMMGEPAGKLAHDSTLADYLAAGKFTEPLRLGLTHPDGPVLALRVVRYIGTEEAIRRHNEVVGQLVDNPSRPVECR